MKVKCFPSHLYVNERKKKKKVRTTSLQLMKKKTNQKIGILIYDFHCIPTLSKLSRYIEGSCVFVSLYLNTTSSINKIPVGICNI